MQLLNSLVAAIALVALTSSGSVDAQRNYAKMDAKAALFKTVANPPTSPDAFFNLIGRNGKYCLRSRRHIATGHHTLSTSTKCSPAMLNSVTSNRSFFRVPAADTEANSDFYIAQYIKGKVQCLRRWRRTGSHKLFFDDCRPDLSYTIREEGNETTPKRLFEFTQLGTGKKRKCLRVTPTGRLQLNRCNPTYMSQQILIVYPTRVIAEEKRGGVKRVGGERAGGERAGEYTQITIASKGYGVSKDERSYEKSQRSEKSYGADEDHSDTDSEESEGEDEE